MYNSKIYISFLFGLLFATTLRAEIVLPGLLAVIWYCSGKNHYLFGERLRQANRLPFNLKNKAKVQWPMRRGNWKVILEPLQANDKPQTMTISGTNTIKLDNILIGEVWVCSGQSNMEYEMRKNSKVIKLDSMIKTHRLMNCSVRQFRVSASFG